MTTHRRVKDLSHELDDDDYDDYEDDYAEDEGQSALSPEDQGLWYPLSWFSVSSIHKTKAQMKAGTVAVREALGPDSSNVSTKEIEEALWHYYYDVEKSVAYIKKQRGQASTQPQAQPKKAKPQSKFDQASSQAAQSPAGESSGFHSFNATATGPLLLRPMRDSGETSVSSAVRGAYQTLVDFSDVPWGGVPLHRRGEISIEPVRMRCGLLGGSGTGKPSKLAALAAQRKKAQEEKRKAGETSTASAALDKLSIRDESSSTPLSAKRPLSTTESQPPRQYSRARKEEPEPKEASKQSGPPTWKPEPSAPVAIPDVRARPSAFASAMLAPDENATMVENHLFSLPYPTTGLLADANPFAAPSPDDIVMKAQSQSKGKSNKPAATKSTNSKSTNGIEKDVAALKISEASKIKSKNLNVQEEYEKSNLKDSASFVVIGHVDHGKSTLMGRLLHDLQIINDRAVNKLQKSAAEAGKSSFGLAWVMDSTAEERARGVTVDIATNNFTTPAKGQHYTILDAPGHQDFIPNMIAGAAQADFAILVIDASTNAFESGLRGQTKEHALLARSMGISRLIVAVNKMDVAEWNEERFNEIKQQMTAFLTTTGFQPSNVAFIPCAGLTGENVATPLPSGVAAWYKDHQDPSKPGPTLVEALDQSSPAARKVTEALRMTISNVFRGSMNSNVSISGRIDAGSLQIGDSILCQPSGEQATIKGIELEDAQPVDWAAAGQIATLHLTDIDASQLRGGDLICSPTNQPIRNVKSLVMKLLAFEHITPGFVEVHKGRMHVAGKISALQAVLNKSNGMAEKKKPRIVQPGALARVIVELNAEQPLESGMRIVLRNEGQTVGAGLIESVEAVVTS